MYITYIVTYKELNTVGQPVKTVKVTAAGSGYDTHANAFVEMMEEDGRTVEIIAMMEETAVNTVSM